MFLFFNSAQMGMTGMLGMSIAEIIVFVQSFAHETAFRSTSFSFSFLSFSPLPDFLQWHTYSANCFNACRSNNSFIRYDEGIMFGTSSLFYTLLLLLCNYLFYYYY